MKTYILIAFALIAAFAANAQVNNLPLIGNRFTLGIDGGAAIPSGDFATSTSVFTSNESNLTGSAKTGLYYDIYGGFRFFRSLGVMVQYGANSNSLNTSGLTPPGGSSSASGEFTTSEYLVGPYLSITLAKIKIEAKLLGGMLSGNYPNISINSAASNITESFNNGTGFGYCAGAKIKYMMIGGMLGIGVGVNYVGSDVKYSGWNQTETGLGTQSLGSPKMSVGLIQPTLGLSLDF